VWHSVYFVLSVALCLNLYGACNCVFISAGMEDERPPLIDPLIDSGHRATMLDERPLLPLVTRTPKHDWRIHPDWTERYGFY
jgi:hypothetical protein